MTFLRRLRPLPQKSAFRRRKVPRTRHKHAFYQGQERHFGAGNEFWRGNKPSCRVLTRLRAMPPKRVQGSSRRALRATKHRAAFLAISVPWHIPPCAVLCDVCTPTSNPLQGSWLFWFAAKSHFSRLASNSGGA